ncbi:MAG: sigma-70 family RNA polymerase sigma factor [Chloroflexi bacterium]|nr:sigma-70 family RNA polymerase sigma factor [Chloroflexota bacterium]
MEGEIVHQEELATLVEQLSYLSQREQDIIALKFDAELSTAQIARILDISEGNVRVIIYRALRKLRDLMLKNESPDA